MATIEKEKVPHLITKSMVDKWNRTNSLALMQAQELDQLKAKLITSENIGKKLADFVSYEWRTAKLSSHTYRAVLIDSSIAIPTTINEIFGKIEEDFLVYSNRILWCNELKSCLSKFEEELEEYDAKYLSWFVSTLKDVFCYNYAEEISEEQLALIKKGIDIIYEKHEDCDKDSFMEYHMLLVESGLSLHPTSKKAIDEFGE